MLTKMRVFYQIALIERVRSWIWTERDLGKRVCVFASGCLGNDEDV